jgi:carboxypeptidase Q
MFLWRVTISIGAMLAIACHHEPAPSIPPEAASLHAPWIEPEVEPTVDIPPVSDDPVVQEIVRLGFTDNRVHEHLKTLTKDIGPRLTSSHNLMRAERWCRDQFEGWGLEARLERWGEFPVGFDRGPASGGMVAPETTPYVFTTPAWTPGAFGPVRGPAVLAPATLRELAGMRDRLSGAWVVDPGKAGRRDPNAKADERLAGALRAAGIAGYVRRARSDEGLVHTGGRYGIQWDALPLDVQVLLRADQYDDLERRLGEGQEVELELSIDNRFFRGPVPQHNVVAELPGTSKPDEVVIVGGHLDSWDGAEGASDNGTGVATTMEAARLLVAAGARPARTIRFVLWGGEEQGLLGSRAYVEQHADELDRISAVFVHDGGTNYLSGIGVTPEMEPQIDAAFAPVTKLSEDKPFEITIVEGLRTGGSDHTPFIRAGVPGFFWHQAGDTDYDYVHHTQHDVLENAVEDYQRHSAMVVAIAAYNVANLDDLLDRTRSGTLARRRVDADFDGLTVKSVSKKGKAAAAGWQTGDRIVTIDGVEVESLRALVGKLQEGEPRKAVVLERGGQRIETVLDYSDDPSEVERAERRRAREAEGLWLPLSE